jgi:5'-phosphate synthase pdxT subunit
MKCIGVLALQGDVPEHRAALARCLPEGAIRLVRTPEELAEVDALVLPGGESTTISELLRASGLDTALEHRARSALPILATCAGLVLVARELEPSPGGRDPTPLSLLDVKVRRNDYGRQRESFEAPVDLEGIPGGSFPGVFIRAPRILSVGAKAKPFARQGDQIVGVRQGAVWGLTFHPELSADPRILRAFLAANGLSPRKGRAGPR